jgi:hypothetical protein
MEVVMFWIMMVKVEYMYKLRCNYKKLTATNEHSNSSFFCLRHLLSSKLLTCRVERALRELSDGLLRTKSGGANPIN